jgi:AI-2 transport protein TqsA
MTSNRVLTFSGALLAVVLAGVVLRVAKPVIFPFFLALFFYFVLSPVFDWLTKRLKISKALTVAIILCFTFFFLYILGAVIYSSGKAFAAELPAYGQKLTDRLASLQNSFKLPKVRWDPLLWIKSLDINQIGSFLLSSLGTFISFVSNLFLVLIFLIFMLAGRGKLNLKIKGSFDARQAEQLNEIVGKVDHQIQKYLGIKTVISLLSGFITVVILAAFGLRFAVLFGFLTFLLNYIPNIGSFIAKIFPFLFAILQFDSFWIALWMLILLTIMDGVTGIIIEPRLMRTGLGLSPLAILFSLFFWAWLWGIPGMFLAVPIMVVMKIICDNVPSMRFIGALLSK